mgnify:CR=1 FL=1
MPTTKVNLETTDLSNYKYDMSRCIKCKGCYWVEHTYMPGVKFSTRCPSNVWNDFDSYGAFGKMRIGTGLIDGTEAREGLAGRPAHLAVVMVEEPDETLYRTYVGGSALACRYLLAERGRIADPLGRPVNAREDRWADLFASHPPMAARIAALRQISPMPPPVWRNQRKGEGCSPDRHGDGDDDGHGDPRLPEVWGQDEDDRRGHGHPTRELRRGRGPHAGLGRRDCTSPLLRGQGRSGRSERALFHYKCTDFYSPKDELTLRWDDPELGIEWPIREAILSEKDARAPRLQDLPQDRLFE